MNSGPTALPAALRRWFEDLSLPELSFLIIARSNLDFFALPVERGPAYTSAEKEPVARQRAFEALFADLLALKGQRLVIERREANQDDRERRLIAQAASARRSTDGPVVLPPPGTRGAIAVGG